MRVNQTVRARLRAVINWAKRFIPTFHGAQPALRGMKLEKPATEGIPDLIPWSQVSSQGQAYLFVTETGERFRDSAGRRVVITVPDLHKKAIVNHALRRWIRSGLRAETIRFAEILPDLRWVGLFLLVDGLAMLALSWETILKAMRAISGNGEGIIPENFRPLLIALAILTSLFWLGIISFALCAGLYLILRPQPKKIMISGTTLTAIDRNEAQRTYSLRELTSVGILRLRFLGGHHLELLFAPARIQIAAQEAHRVFGSKVNQRQPGSGAKDGRFIRVAFFSILAAISTFLLVRHFSIPAEDSDGKGLSPWGASLIVLAFGLLHAVVLTPLPAKLFQRYHRWSMKKRRAKPKTNTMPLSD